jgi:dihydroxyacetone kinase
MKKFINRPEDVSRELAEGLVMARHGGLRILPDVNVILTTRELPDEKVRIVIGGGGGHEPVFAGFVGVGMADASANGDVFTSPSMDTVEAAIREIYGERGVILIYGNYQGDILNFDMAQDICRADGLTVDTVRTTDDISSAGPDQKDERRGTAADLFVIKIAGAASERGWSFEEVLRVARKANDNCRTMGIALSSCTVPSVGRPTFEIEPEIMMVGMGLHGEAGVSVQQMATADDSTAIMLNALLDDDLVLAKGDNVALLINGYGATTQMELYIVNRAANNMLADRGISVDMNIVGNYCTSLEMAGCSLTLMKLDKELEDLMGAAADTPGYVQFEK